MDLDAWQEDSIPGAAKGRRSRALRPDVLADIDDQLRSVGIDPDAWDDEHDEHDEHDERDVLPAELRSSPRLLRSTAELRPIRPSYDEDLPPLQSPPGYVRDGRGAWRYRANSQYVPGARDVTLDRLHRFDVVATWVTIPTQEVARREELSWCKGVADPAGPDSTPELHPRSAVAVPLDEWARRSRVPLSMTAPELDVSRLVDLDGVAAWLGVQKPTISSYLARDRFPEPVGRVANSPVWTRPIVELWARGRPGQGRRAGPDVRSQNGLDPGC